MIVEISVSDLHKGHYVVDFVKQHNAYKLVKAARIAHEKTIKRIISSGIDTLLIDTEKSDTYPENAARFTNKQATHSNNHNRPIILTLKKAQKLFTDAKILQQKVFTDAYQGKPLNLTSINEAVDKNIEAVYKESESLTCTLNIRKPEDYLFEHSVSVSILMIIFAKYLKIDKHIVQLLSVGAFLHDVGKIKIPADILNKKGKLSLNEQAIMQTHVEHSLTIMSTMADISELSLEVVAMHHEQPNGEGYPYQLSGEQVTLYGRMMAICDNFDALISNRCYQRSNSYIKAFNILRNLAHQGRLDLALVDHFIKCMGVYPVGSIVELASHKLAIVESRNENNPICPKVRTFYSTTNDCYIMAENIDLAVKNDFIVKGVRADDFDFDMAKIIDFLLVEG